MGLYVVQNVQINDLLDTDYNSSSKGSQNYHRMKQIALYYS